MFDAGIEDFFFSESNIIISTAHLDLIIEHVNCSSWTQESFDFLLIFHYLL